jgi:hypothetical protein
VSLTYAIIATKVNYKTYQELATHLIGLDHTQRRLKAITSAEKAARPKSSTTNTPLRSVNTNSRSATPRGDAPRTSENTASAYTARTADPYWTKERTQLYEEGRCFTCKSKDHMDKNCPIRAARQERRDRRIAVVEVDGDNDDDQGKGRS